MALKAIATIDDATVAVKQATIFVHPDGSVSIEYSGTVDQDNGAPYHLQPAQEFLTGAAKTTVTNFFASRGIPALKAANGL